MNNKPNPALTEPPALLRYTDVARMLNTSRSVVNRLVREGELTPVNLSRKHNGIALFRRTDIEAFIRDLPEAQAS